MHWQPNILVVEDEPSVAELIAVNLRYNGYRVTCSKDGLSAQQELNKQDFDLILLDWMLPGKNGIQLSKSWRSEEKTQNIPIILLTARSSEIDKITGLDSGADDYVSKPFSTKELLARIRAILRRSVPKQEQTTVKLGNLTLDTSTHRAHYNNNLIKLAPTEFKLLHYLMLNAERVHSRSQLLDQVWGNHVYIEERTVDVHVKRLREALGDAAHMIETIRGAGYRITNLINS